MFRIFIEKKAKKELERLDEKTRRRVLDALIVLRDEGFSRRIDIRKLKGTKNHYRLRVGSLRILFEPVDDKILVYAILPRRKAYKK